MFTHLTRLLTQAMAEVTKEGLYPNPLVTELVPLEKLWPGEDYHQNYYKDNPNQVGWLCKNQHSHLSLSTIDTPDCDCSSQ
jgi:peptide methionine sulfoxide reductase MsrA